MCNTEYNGWANYHTWNVALWLGNERDLYEKMCRYVKGMPESQDDEGLYDYFVRKIMGEEWGDITPDGVSWTDPFLDHDELDEYIKRHSELVEG